VDSPLESIGISSEGERIVASLVMPYKGDSVIEVRGFPGGAPPVPPPDAGAGPGAPPALPAAPPNAVPVAAGRDRNQKGWLKVVTTNVKSGYLRKNGVPYSDKATITEYFQPTPETYGVRYMIVTMIIEDPEYLRGPLITSSNHKKLPDTNNGSDPQPCSVK
jgi:hypothetical protein